MMGLYPRSSDRILGMLLFRMDITKLAVAPGRSPDASVSSLWDILYKRRHPPIEKDGITCILKSWLKSL